MRFFIPIFLLSVAIRLGAQPVITWSQTITVAPASFGGMHPRIAVDGSGNPLVLWGNGNAKKVLFSRWTGSGFAAPVALNPDTIPVFAASWAGPDLAAHGDTVFAVFKETPEDANGIYLVRSFDGGQNYLDPVRVDNIADSISRFPSLTCDDFGNPMVAFMKFNPGWGNPRYVLAKSDNGGGAFNVDMPASGFSGGVVCDCCPATITASGNTVAVLYRDNLNNLRNSWAGISTDNGENFGSGIPIDNTNWFISACPSSGPDAVIYEDKLYAVFMSGANGKTRCYRSRSALSTQQLDLIEPLTGDFAGLGQQNFPRIASSGNVGAIAWIQTVNGNAQLALQFTDTLSSGFSGQFTVLAQSHVANTDITFARDGRIYVVWEDDSNGTTMFKSGEYSLSGSKSPVAENAPLRVFPNPANELVLNVFTGNSENDLVAYDFWDLFGNQVNAGKAFLSAGSTQVDISNLIPGCYVFRMIKGNQIYRQQVIVAR